MYYSQLRNMVMESEIYMYIHLINRIKECRHNKIKEKQINKFECLVLKGNVDVWITLHDLTTALFLTTLTKILL